MNAAGLGLGILLGAIATSAHAQPAGQDLVWRQWALNCQGCHQPEGLGIRGATPALKGQVSRFTLTAEGRDYLGRVPGVANAPLSDADLAGLLNWLLARFDPDHLRPDFEPYTAAEVSRLRARPLRSDASSVRARLVNGWPEPSSRPQP